MSWASGFALANGWALLCWLLLLIGPRGPKTASVILYAGVMLLCLCYALIFTSLLLGWAGSAGGDFTSITGVRAFFASDPGLLAGWIHYLAFDLFTGLWISKDADHKGFGRPTQLPFLILTCFVGPVGLLLWLVVREKRARAAQ